MELWDVYDCQRNKLGKTWVRGEEMAAGEYHMVVEVWTINDRHQMLVTQRDPVKRFAYQWECTGGAAIVGEDSLDAAVRELQEETGLVAQREEMRLIGSETIPERNYFLDTYIYRTDKAIGEMSWQPGEVINGKYVSIEEFEQMNERGEVVYPVWQRFLQYREELIQEIKR